MRPGSAPYVYQNQLRERKRAEDLANRLPDTGPVPPRESGGAQKTGAQPHKSFMETSCPWDTSDVSFRPTQYVPRRDNSIRTFTNDRSSAGRPEFYRELNGWNRLS